MSLFPAYAEISTEQTKQQVTTQTAEKKNDKDVSGQTWLENSSYQEISSLVTDLQNDDWTDSSEDEASTVDQSKKVAIIDEKRDHKSLKNESYKKKQKHSNKYDNFFEDRKRNKLFFTNFSAVSSNKKQKRRNFTRYYEKKTSSKKRKTGDPSAVCEENAEIVNFSESQENEIQSKHKETTEEFNVKLAENPKDVSLWLKYVQFQDHIAQLQQFCKKSDSQHILNQKKLSIVEKALMENKDSMELFKMKLQLMAQLLPADQFSNQIEIMIQKDPKNFLLWQVLIQLIQTSCSLCKVSKILHYYTKCFTILKQKSKTDAKFYDEQVLSLLYQCLTFLRHAGLWEQMWEIIKINLCLNLTLDRESLEDVKVIDDQSLMNMEEVVLTSRLPLNQLWLRIESLRENCYWTGIDVKKVDVSLIGDEKRLVSAEEINDFIYPTISKQSNFRIALLSILCLKVPLLPSRHCTLQDFKLDELCWSTDSLEFILPMIYSTLWVGETKNSLCDEKVMRSLLEGSLTSGPQFLKYHPAQELYMDFVRLFFKTVAQKLLGNDKISILVWWLKFERLLLFVTKNDPLREKNRSKKVKSVVKNFLKDPENRSNLYFYREFALIEYELGSSDNCIETLKKIILLQDTSFLSFDEKVALLSLYRTIFEVLLNSNTLEDKNLETFREAVKSLEKFVYKCFKHDPNLSVMEMLYNEILKFFSEPLVDESEEYFLLSNIHCDMTICYAYLLYTKSYDNFEDILDLFDRCIAHCEKCVRLQERFYETKLLFLQFCKSKDHVYGKYLKSSTSQALEKYPNNFLFLSVNSMMEIEQPFWKLKTPSENSSVWSVLASCLAGRARISYLKKIDAEETHQAMINKMLAFHKKIGKTQDVQSCPLVWRFYMLLLQEQNLCEKKGEEIYYEAASQCPWARNVYISAAEIAPQILSQIQDLIKEKELRIHVTPEELDILRES